MDIQCIRLHVGPTWFWFVTDQRRCMCHDEEISVSLFLSQATVLNPSKTIFFRNFNAYKMEDIPTVLLYGQFSVTAPTAWAQSLRRYQCVTIAVRISQIPTSLID